MYISQLKNKLDNYDIYGGHRINGLKALYLFEILCLFNFLYPIRNPYFYFFYVPLTVYAVESTGETLRERALFFTLGMVGSIVTIGLFGLLSGHPTFFIGFVFLYSTLMYYLVIAYIPKMLFIVPIILSLAGYSLIYHNADSNIYIAFNNCMISLTALLVILAGLISFPKIYYEGIWMRAFQHSLLALTSLSNDLCHNKLAPVPICPSVIIMRRYSKMLPKSSQWFSMLKITLLTFDLIMAMSHWHAFSDNLNHTYKKLVHHYIKMLSNAFDARKPIRHDLQELFNLRHIKEFAVLYRLIRSWNILCPE